MKFSKRTEWDTEESSLAQAHRERLATGLAVADLTASNPTRCGLDYPADLLSPLTDAAAYDYDPNPKGSLRAREAICRYYSDQGVAKTPDQILLTTSTSEAYGYIFKLLCNSGDVVLVPQPSYPLFDFLAQAEAVQLATAPLVYDYGWQLDLEGLRRQITTNTRAVVLVHPNNPTGHFTKLEEARELAAICREHGLALIVDEVFLDYGLDDGLDYALERMGVEAAGSRSSFAARDLGILVFIVSGISKICALPQMKVAWLIAIGPGSGEALVRLEVVADTYLSMNAPVQLALPVWLEKRDSIQAQIRDRVRSNLAELDRVLADQAEGRTGGTPVNRLRVEGGWYVLLRIPAVQADEVTCLELLKRGVLVHPGYFFGMGPSGWLVISLLARPSEFSIGILVLLGYFGAESGQLLLT
jgi:aspartate/methionine/tyrosine aminotransferase